MQLRKIIEEWAAAYKPIAHDMTSIDPAMRRYFEADGIDDMLQVIQTLALNRMPGPFVVFDTTISASIENKAVVESAGIYFMVPSHTDGFDKVRAQTLAKEEARMHAVRFINRMRKLKSGYTRADGVRVPPEQALRYLRLEERIPMISVGPILSDLWGVEIILEWASPVGGCDAADDSLYNNP